MGHAGLIFGTSDAGPAAVFQRERGLPVVSAIDHGSFYRDRFLREVFR